MSALHQSLFFDMMLPTMVVVDVDSLLLGEIGRNHLSNKAVNTEIQGKIY